MDGTVWLCVCCVCVHASYPYIDIRASCHHTVSLRSLSVSRTQPAHNVAGLSLAGPEYISDYHSILVNSQFSLREICCFIAKK